MKLTYTRHAGRDLARLYEFIHRKNPQAARKASRQLKKSIESIIEMPLMGIVLPELDEFRELVSHDYIVRYRILPDEIVILNIWHAKEDRLTMPVDNQGRG